MHPSTESILKYFEFEHLPVYLQPEARHFHSFAQHLASAVKEGPELTACLRKLLEAKDCAVRASLE